MTRKLVVPIFVMTLKLSDGLCPDVRASWNGRGLRPWSSHHNEGDSDGLHMGQSSCPNSFHLEE